MADADNQRPIKRSFTIRGHRTSVSLEPPFWEALRVAAQQDQTSLAALVTHIDVTRGKVGLSSAVRVYVFKRFTTLPPND